MEFNLITYNYGIVAVIVGLLVIILLGASVVAGYIKNVNTYEERKKSNYFMMNGVNKKVKVEDIRDAVSLGYMDLQIKIQEKIEIEKPKTTKYLSFSHTNSTGDFIGRQ